MPFNTFFEGVDCLSQAHIYQELTADRRTSYG